MHFYDGGEGDGPGWRDTKVKRALLGIAENVPARLAGSADICLSDSFGRLAMGEGSRARGIGLPVGNLQV
jgi:hypothetical protein